MATPWRTQLPVPLRRQTAPLGATAVAPFSAQLPLTVASSGSNARTPAGTLARALGPLRIAATFLLVHVGWLMFRETDTQMLLQHLSLRPWESSTPDREGWLVRPHEADRQLAAEIGADIGGRAQQVVRKRFVGS